MRALRLVAVGLLASCSRTPTSPPSPAVPPVGAVALFDRLALEADRKDQADPPTSKVLAALTSSGLTLIDRRQQSAANARAAYCLMVTTDEGVTLSICEFPDGSSAALGAEASRSALRQIEGSSVEVNRSTTLAVIDSRATPASVAIKEKARAAFRSL